MNSEYLESAGGTNPARQFMSASSLLKVLAVMLLTLAWLNPLHIGPWVSWHSEVLAFCSAGLLFVAVLAAGRVAIKIPQSGWIWIALSLIITGQYFAGLIDYGGDFFTLLFYFAAGFAVFVSGFAIGLDTDAKGNELALYALAGALVFAACASVMIAIAQTLDVWLDVEWISRAYNLRRPGANIAQTNQLATLLLMGALSLTYLSHRFPLHRLTVLFIYGVIIVGLGLTESRSGVLSAVAVFGLWLYCRGRVFPKASVWWPLAGLLFLLLCFKFAPFISDQIQLAGGTQTSTVAVNLNAGTRLLIWPQLLEASLQHPWAGWGLRQVPMAHNAVLSEYQLAEPFTYAHNIVLDLILGIGYPLTALLVFAFCVWAIRRVRRSASLDTWYCLALLTPFLVHSMLEFPFAYAYFLIPIAFVLGMLEAKLAPSQYMTVTWGTGVASTVAVICLMAWSVWEYVQIEEDYRVARFEVLKIGKTPVDYDRPNTIMLTQLGAMLDGIRLVPEPGMKNERIEAARKVAMRFPWPALQNRYALVLALNGNPTEALRQLKVLRAMHGEKTYQGILSSWREIADDKYPQLKDIVFP